MNNLRPCKNCGWPIYPTGDGSSTSRKIFCTRPECEKAKLEHRREINRKNAKISRYGLSKPQKKKVKIDKQEPVDISDIEVGIKIIKPEQLSRVCVRCTGDLKGNYRLCPECHSYLSDINPEGLGDEYTGFQYGDEVWLSK